MAMTDLEQTAMERLRLASQMSLKLYKQPLLLTDSGGKDSAVICKLAENAGMRCSWGMSRSYIAKTASTKTHGKNQKYVIGSGVA